MGVAKADIGILVRKLFQCPKDMMGPFSLPLPLVLCSPFGWGLSPFLRMDSSMVSCQESEAYFFQRFIVALVQRIGFLWMINTDSQKAGIWRLIFQKQVYEG